MNVDLPEPRSVTATKSPRMISTDTRAGHAPFAAQHVVFGESLGFEEVFVISAKRRNASLHVRKFWRRQVHADDDLLAGVEAAAYHFVKVPSLIPRPGQSAAVFPFLRRGRPFPKAETPSWTAAKRTYFSRCSGRAGWPRRSGCAHAEPAFPGGSLRGGILSAQASSFYERRRE